MCEPIPDPVPPAMLCAMTNPCRIYTMMSKAKCQAVSFRRTSRLSLLSASLLMISITCSTCFCDCPYPLAQLLPAPPPVFDVNTFSRLYRFFCAPVVIWFMTCQGNTGVGVLYAQLTAARNKRQWLAPAISARLCCADCVTYARLEVH